MVYGRRGASHLREAALTVDASPKQCEFLSYTFSCLRSQAIHTVKQYKFLKVIRFLTYGSYPLSTSISD